MNKNRFELVSSVYPTGGMILVEVEDEQQFDRIFTQMRQYDFIRVRTEDSLRTRYYALYAEHVMLYLDEAKKNAGGEKE